MKLKPEIQKALSDPKVSNLVLRPIDYRNDGRFGLLSKREGYYRGTIFDSRPFDWNGEFKFKSHFPMMGSGAMSLQDSPPISQRTPNSPYHLGRVIVNRFVEMLFGEKRFPKVEVPTSPTTELYLNRLVRVTQLKSHMIEAATLGGSMGSVITMFKVVDTQFRLESFSSKWCKIEWDDYHSAEMHAFSVCYAYDDHVYEPQEKKWALKTFLYRRVVTKEVDVTYLPQEAVADSKGIRAKNENEAPQPDPEQAFYHNFGFVPGVFVQNVPRHDEIDGDTCYEGAETLIERISENLSAIHSALQGNLDPTLVLKMTPEDYKKLQGMGGVVATGSSGAAVVVGDRGDAKYIEITCEGIKVALEVIALMKACALELCDCVIADPHKLTGAAQSAAAMKLLYGPMLSKCDVMRTQYGENGIKKLLSKMINAFHNITSTRVENDDVVRGKLKDVRAKDPKTGAKIIVTPESDVDLDEIELVWGEYFAPTTADVFQAIESATMAAGGKAVTTQKQAATYASAYLNDPDLETTLVEIVTEAKQDRENEMEMQKAGAAAKAKPVSGPQPKKPARPPASASQQ